jgi:hypothetical protein
LTVFRERIVKRSVCKWVSPVHEYLKFNEGTKLGRLTDCKLIHAPIGDRKANDARNLRILESIPREERTKSHRFHLFQSLRAVGRTGDAVTECVAMLRDREADIGQAERYELFIAAGQLSDDTGMRANMMLQALATDPGRREAYGEMALCMLALGKPDHALSYTIAMRALRMPPDAAWNARRKYYGWLGEGLHGMALRANGRPEEADACERNHFIRHGAKISLIHATRGRVKQAVACRRKWLESASNADSVEHIFAIDIDDEESYALTVHNFVMLPAGLGPVAAWNAAADKSAGAVLAQLSDAWEPFPGWDSAILEAIGDTSREAVLAISDGGRKDDLLCMAIMTRARYKAQGHMFHPDFFSVYSDDWFTHCAYRDGVVIDAREKITFEHRHPAFGKAEMDATYAHGNSQAAYHNGKKTLERLMAE